MLMSMVAGRQQRSLVYTASVGIIRRLRSSHLTACVAIRLIGILWGRMMQLCLELHQPRPDSFSLAPAGTMNLAVRLKPYQRYFLPRLKTARVSRSLSFFGLRVRRLASGIPVVLIQDEIHFFDRALKYIEILLDSAAVGRSVERQLAFQIGSKLKTMAIALDASILPHIQRTTAR